MKQKQYFQNTVYIVIPRYTSPEKQVHTQQKLSEKNIN